MSSLYGPLQPPASVFAVERVSSQFPEGWGAEEGRNPAFKKYVFKVQRTVLVKVKGKLDLY